MSNPRFWAPIVMIIALLGGMLWVISLGTLPRADFTFVNGTEIETIDPARVTGEPEGNIVRALFEGLVRWDPRDLTPSPAQAESWEISDDLLTYTFQIRDNAVWSDGTPVTAEDFAYSFRRFLHPGTLSEYAYQLWYVDRARDYTLARFQVGDPVEIELLEREPGALPGAPGKMLHGTLVSADPPLPPPAEDDAEDDHGDGADDADSDEASVVRTFTVEIDGQQRRFRKGGGDGTEDYQFLLLDFSEVGIRATGDLTLEIRLANPTPYFLSLLGFYPLSPVNRECVERYPFPLWTRPEHLVSNGPFLLHSRRIRDRVRMVKNPTYWDAENVHLNVVDALAVESAATALNMYMTGEVDFIKSVPVTAVQELLAQNREDFQPTEYFGTYYYRLNTTRAPLDDPRVRRALNMAIDKRSIVENVTRAGQIPARGLVPPNLPGYESALCDDYNPEEARRLLAEAGYPGGRGFPSGFQLMYNTNDMHQSIAELVQSQWKRELGIDVEIRGQEWAAYLSRQKNLEYWVSRAAWIGDYLDPNTFLDMFVTGGANNQTGWGNPEYDRLISAASVETDPQKRLEMLHQAEVILMDQMPIIPVYFYVTISMQRPYVKGWYHNIQDVHPLVGVWIDEEEKQRTLSNEGVL